MHACLAAAFRVVTHVSILVPQVVLVSSIIFKVI